MSPGQDRSTGRRDPKEGEGIVIQDGIGPPVAVPDGKEDWDLQVTGYPERMSRPIVTRTRRCSAALKVTRSSSMGSQSR